MVEWLMKNWAIWVPILISLAALYVAYQQLLKQTPDDSPVLDLVITGDEGRQWPITVTLTNKSPTRIQLVEFQMPKPNGISLRLKDAPDASYETNINWKGEGWQSIVPAAPLQPGQSFTWTGRLFLDKSAPLARGTKARIEAKVRFLGDKEREETLSSVRTINR